MGGNVSTRSRRRRFRWSSYAFAVQAGCGSEGAWVRLVARIAALVGCPWRSKTPRANLSRLPSVEGEADDRRGPARAYVRGFERQLLSLFTLRALGTAEEGKAPLRVRSRDAGECEPLLAYRAARGVTVAFIVGLLNAGSSLAIMRIPTTPLSALGCLVLCDFLYYVDHRAGHRVRLYWAISHSVHHSSPQYDQTTALRVSVVDGYTSPWFQVPAVLVGFDPILVLASFGVIISYQQWIHTESIGKLGPEYAPPSWKRTG